jgi:hypothetical protein
VLTTIWSWQPPAESRTGAVGALQSVYLIDLIVISRRTIDTTRGSGPQPRLARQLLEQQLDKPTKSDMA